LYLDDLKENNLCVAMSYSSGAIDLMRSNSDIELIIPDNHALMTVDSAVIPQTAQNVDGAIAFIEYLLQPKVAAQIINSSYYGSTMVSTQQFVADDLKEHKFLFPTKETLRTFSLVKSLNRNQQKAINQNWAEIM